MKSSVSAFIKKAESRINQMDGTGYLSVYFIHPVKPGAEPTREGFVATHGRTDRLDQGQGEAHGVFKSRIVADLSDRGEVGFHIVRLGAAQ